MGTRSLTIFTNEHEEIVVMYRQMDGYPSGHGLELAEFLSGFKIVNGIVNYHDKIANGLSCLAAQVVASFKDGPGGFYLHSAGTRDIGEEYRYYVYGNTGEEPQITICKINSNDEEETLFFGSATQAVEFCNKEI